MAEPKGLSSLSVQIFWQMLLAQTFRIRNVSIATVAAIFFLTVGSIFYWAPNPTMLVSFPSVVLLVAFLYAIPLGCGLLFYQVLRKYFDTDKKNISWVSILAGIAILSGYGLYLNLLWISNWEFIRRILTAFSIRRALYNTSLGARIRHVDVCEADKWLTRFRSHVHLRRTLCPSLYSNPR